MNELETMIKAAVQAGRAILEIYESDYAVHEKADHSPLTEADRRAHDVIMDYLKPLGIPVLSEEGRHIPYSERKEWKRFFLVDPLDGTKEFIKRNGEFTVNIAVIEDARPVSGVIYVPVKDVLYVADTVLGARKVDGLAQFEDIGADAGMAKIEKAEKAGRPLPLKPEPGRPYTVIGSRSHGSPELESFVARKRIDHGDVAFISAGSSLKFCRVAEGSADVYPRTGPTCEWDTAAGQAIAEQAGCTVNRFDTNEPLMYNKKELLNPWFIVERR